MSSEFIFENCAPVPDPHMMARTKLLVALMATCKTSNAGAFTREQQLVSLSICVEKTIAALEAELGAPTKEAVDDMAMDMALLAFRTG